MINNVLLLLQKESIYPKAHPLSQCPLAELQGRLCKQFPLHCVIQSLPYIPFLQPVKNLLAGVSVRKMAFNI